MYYEAVLYVDGIETGRAILRGRDGNVFSFTDATFGSRFGDGLKSVRVARPRSAPIILDRCRVIFSEHGAMELFVKPHDVIDPLAE